MSEKTENERLIVTVKGDDYFVDSMPNNAKTALFQIEDIEKKKLEYSSKLTYLDYSKAYLVDFLANEIEKNPSDFEKAPKKEANNAE